MDLLRAAQAGDWAASERIRSVSERVTLIELLLAHGADPNQAGEDGRSAYATATALGRGDLLELLVRHGARDDTTPLDRLRYACLRGDRAGALELLSRHPALRTELAGADGTALIGAAEAGDTAGVELLLEAGFPPAAPGGPSGGTPLHAAAWAGADGVVERLLAAGAPVDAHDSTWDSTPLVWALVGSGERSAPNPAPRSQPCPALPTLPRAPNPAPDWYQTVRILLDAGASTRGINLDELEPDRPEPKVVDLLRARGIVPPLDAQG